MARALTAYRSPAIAGLLAAILATSLVAKVRVMENLQLTLQRDLYLSGALAAPLAIMLVGAEALVVGLLLVRRTRGLGFLGAMALSSLFMSFGFWRWWSGVTAPCTCFGLLLTMTPLQSMALSASMLAGSIVGLRLHEMILQKEKVNDL